jgi:hypothetical protein
VIPQANPCERTSGWLVADLGAEAHYECELVTSPPADDLEGGSLTYGRFATADLARRRFDEALEFEYSDGARPCDRATVRAVRARIGAGEAECLITDEWAGIWWTPDRSRVLGILDFAPSTNPEALAKAWERVLDAG